MPEPTASDDNIIRTAKGEKSHRVVIYGSRVEGPENSLKAISGTTWCSIHISKYNKFVLLWNKVRHCSKLLTELIFISVCSFLGGHVGYHDGQLPMAMYQPGL